MRPCARRQKQRSQKSSLALLAILIYDSFVASDKIYGGRYEI